MNYQKIYDNIISSAKNRKQIIGYKEIHHILPKSLGGLDDEDNLVELSPREHFICHLLLTKTVNDVSSKYKMLLAYRYMANSSKVKFNSRLYEKLKIKFSQAMSEVHWTKTRGFSDTHKSKLKLARKKRKEKYGETKKGGSTKGTKWIFNPLTLERKMIYNWETPQHGWQYGKSPKNIKSATRKYVSEIVKHVSWKFISPDGTLYFDKKMSNFCQKHKLNQGNMSSVASGKLSDHKGWKCEKITTLSERLKYAYIQI